MKHRALIIGCGRIGVGFDWPAAPYVYTHADAYLALKDRAELVGVVDKEDARLAYAENKYQVAPYLDARKALEQLKPDVVSLCVPPQEQGNVMRLVLGNVKGVWAEKPYCGYWDGSTPIQVNYVRRFDRAHRAVKELLKTKPHACLYIWAKEDVHTECHFEDLAEFWGIDKKRVIYQDNTGESPSTNKYVVMAGKWSISFENGGVEGGFMETALGELLDCIEGRGELSSPAYPLKRRIHAS